MTSLCLGPSSPIVFYICIFWTSPFQLAMHWRKIKFNQITPYFSKTWQGRQARKSSSWAELGSNLNQARPKQHRPLLWAELGLWSWLELELFYFIITLKSRWAVQNKWFLLSYTWRSFPVYLSKIFSYFSIFFHDEK